MKFIDLPHPLLSCNHVLTRSRLLYRLDAYTDAGAIVVNEYEGHHPAIELNGDPATCQKALWQVLSVVAITLYPQFSLLPPPSVPNFTLDLRLRPDDQVLVLGINKTVRFSTLRGKCSSDKLMSDLAEVNQRLTEIGRAYYH